MEQLRNAAERRAVTFIAGEAGVGKSRMGREAAVLADNMGLSRFMGSCTADPTVPYAPFVTAIRRRLQVAARRRDAIPVLRVRHACRQPPP